MHVYGHIRISIHALRVEGDHTRRGSSRMSRQISIHALRVEGDNRRPYRFLAWLRRFLSTPSGWRATGCRPLPDTGYSISIHALRVEGDKSQIEKITIRYISIHALRVEGDLRVDRPKLEDCRFLSTPSGWRATQVSQGRRVRKAEFLSTPSGWRATNEISVECASCDISIHALRVEGDTL